MKKETIRMDTPEAQENQTSLRPKASLSSSERTGFTVARWRISGEVALEETVTVTIVLRRAIMALAGAEGSLPPTLSGHEGERFATDSRPRHRHDHAFFLAEDADRDGLIDHVLLHLPRGFDNTALRAADRLRSLWDGPSGDWRILQHWIATPGEPLGSLCGSARLWESLTPFFFPRFLRKGQTVADQLRWQCSDMGLPQPANVERLDHWGGLDAPPSPYRRRPPNDRHPVHPDPHGGRWRLTFTDPVEGPIALGEGCHFGLGVFRRME